MCRKVVGYLNSCKQRVTIELGNNGWFIFREFYKKYKKNYFIGKLLLFIIKIITFPEGEKRGEFVFFKDFWTN